MRGEGVQLCSTCQRACPDDYAQCPECGAPLRESSMRTLFEVRARPWLVRSLIALALAGVGYAVTRSLH